MPFDSQGQEFASPGVSEPMIDDPVLRVLTEARRVITPAECWLQNIAFHRDERGHFTAACALGALNWAEDNLDVAGIYMAAREMLFQALPTEGEKISGSEIALFNDTHSHAEVLALFDRAIAARKAEV